MEDNNIVLGRNPVLEYIKNAELKNDYQLYIYKNAHGKILKTIIHEAEKKSIQIYHEDKDFFQKLSPSAKHQGVALRVPHAINKIHTGSILDKALMNKGAIVLLDQLTDPHNVGSIIRTAEALGADGIVIPKSNASGINPTVVKSSAGATANINIEIVSNVSAFLDNAKKQGFWIVGSSERGDSNIYKMKDLKPAVLIIGNEEKGIRRLTQGKCDFIVKIPLKGKTASLNASVAAGIILYEFFKADK